MKKNEAIGKAGEDEVAAALTGIEGARLLRNLYIPCGNGRTAEIDALIVHRKGLFAIECKAWGGHLIRGSMRLNDWSVKATPSSKPVKRYSPIKQAEGHAKSLARYLKLPVSKRPHNIIVFTSTTAKLKVPKGDESFSIIQGTGALRSAVEKRLRLRNETFTTEQLQTIIESLEKTTDPPDKKKKAHIKQARKSQRRRLAIKEKRRRAGKKSAKKKPKKTVAKRASIELTLLNLHHWLL
ncbi:MAG: NERD domain-containing protein [Eggerthellaceae bacterium]|nr:NERD domain-containing protein [Eggerthellaceae bacterium]